MAKELGERKIIDVILACLDQIPNSPLPFGDDASALEMGNNKLLVINTDMLVKKTDVPPTMNLWQAARKAVVMNISDLAAKGVQPLAVLVSIGITLDLKKNEIKQIGEGLNAGAREYDTYIIGGDTNEASDLIISGMAIGICDKNHLMKRSGAIPGDFVAVTGSFGKTASGLKILIDRLSAPEIQEVLIESILMPKARVKEGIALAKSLAATSSIDSSDGLAWSLHEISRSSNVGFCINNIPISPEVKKFAKVHNLDVLELALYGGEEYEIIVTINPNLWEKAKEAIDSVGGNLTKIGIVTKEKKCVLNLNQKIVDIAARGWEHFKTD